MTNISIPADMIRDIVQKTVTLEVAKAIGDGDNGKRFIEACVRAAIEAPVDNYSRESKFNQQVKAMIGELAVECVKEVLAEHRPIIKKTIKDRMGKDANKWVEAVATKLSDSVTTDFAVHISLPRDER